MSPELGPWVGIWGGIAVFLLLRHTRVGGHVGLLVTFVMSLAALHWLAPALYVVSPDGSVDQQMTLLGLRQSVIAMLGLAGGAEVAARLRLSLDAGDDETSAPASGMRVPGRLVNLYLISGAVLYVVLFSAVGQLPTVRALISTGSTLMVVGIALKCWNAWQSNRSLYVWLWLAAAAGFPVLTVVAQGFLGYGLAAMVMVFTFFASLRRLTWRLVALGLLVGYLGLSVYVTYMRDRLEIREAVWGGASTTQRLDQLEEAVERFEWFDWRNPEHFQRINVRLNQNYLVGMAVYRLESGYVEYASGRTIWEAILALVPRAVWPDKPIAAGSGDLVSEFTGMRFAEGTSVGVGQVLEWYVNFGTAGVFAGFGLVGFLLVLIDRSAAGHLTRGQPSQFLLWYLPGLSLLQVGGSLAEVTAMAGGSYVVATAFAHVARALPAGAASPVSAEEATV